MSYFTLIAQSPEPLRRVRTMTDGGLNGLIKELAKVEKPNDFHAEIYAMAMHEVLLRWRQTLLSTDLEQEGSGDLEMGSGGDGEN